MSRTWGFYWPLPQINSVLIDNFSWNDKISSFHRLQTGKLIQNLIHSRDMIKLWAAKIKIGRVKQSSVKN